MSNTMLEVLFAVLLILSFLTGRPYRPGNVGLTTSARRVQYSVTPMHPACASRLQVSEAWACAGLRHATGTVVRTRSEQPSFAAACAHAQRCFRL
jgi:hypothetical protein